MAFNYKAKASFNKVVNNLKARRENEKIKRALEKEAYEKANRSSSFMKRIPRNVGLQSTRKTQVGKLPMWGK